MFLVVNNDTVYYTTISLHILFLWTILVFHGILSSNKMFLLIHRELLLHYSAEVISNNNTFPLLQAFELSFPYSNNASRELWYSDATNEWRQFTVIWYQASANPLTLVN